MGNSSDLRYNSTIGYLKAFGIILMLLGHTGLDNVFMKFVVMFHMPLFFIASGYCFKEKYLSNPVKYLRNKIKGIWWPYVKWSLLFLFLHNIFFHMHLYNEQYDYWRSASDVFFFPQIIKTSLAVTMTMHGTEPLLGGYWFLNALFFGSIIAWLIIKYVRNLILGGGILLTVCLIFNESGKILPFVQISARTFAAALFILIGYALAKYKVRIFNSEQIIVGMLITVIGSLFWYMPLHPASYSNYRFLPYIVSATVATWSFYSLFNRMKGMQSVGLKILDFIGRNTLTILTWHFLSFKLVSFAIVYINGIPMTRLSEHPVIVEYSVKGWWLAYFLTAMLVTCGVAYCNKWIKYSWLKL